MELIDNCEFQILKEGNAELQPQRSDLCKIDLIGKLEDGTTVEELTNHTVQVGDVELVQSLDMALALMKVGEVAEVTVDPRFGYGSIGLKNETNPEKSIPPNAKVIFDIFMTVFDQL